MLDEQQIENIFQIWAKSNPNPKTELEYSNVFTLAVAVILSAQATDISVNKATKSLFTQYDNPEKLLDLGVDGLKGYIKSIGLYNSKAKNIISLCQILIEQYDSQIPDNFSALIKLPGIGTKTAKVILNCGFGKPYMAVDTHIFRVSKRLGLSSASTPDKMSLELERIIPEKWLLNAHHWLILHGRYICKARTPICGNCPVQNDCEYYQNIK